AVEEALASALAHDARVLTEETTPFPESTMLLPALAASLAPNLSFVPENIFTVAIRRALAISPRPMKSSRVSVELAAIGLFLSKRVTVGILKYSGIPS